MKNILKNKKLYIILGIIAVIVLVIVAIIIFNKKEETHQEKLERQLKEMGQNFYEIYYYDKINKNEEEKKAFLELYKSIGIKIDLDNLGRYNSEENKEIVEGFINHETNEACNKTETKVIIYPESPYGKTDYKLETILSCGYEEKQIEE